MRWRSVPVLLGLAAIIALAVMKHSERTDRQQPEKPGAEQRDERIESAHQAAETPQSSRSCPGSQLEVVLDGNAEVVCLGTLATIHNGSVRSHQVATLTEPQRWLRVEVAGGTILSAAWGSELRPDFHCQAAECKGITISRRDALGVRAMTLERVSLPSKQASLQLSGRIDIPAEELSELACVDQGVSIVTSDSSSQTFCPQGGAGFEIADDGTKRYRFTSLDGESLVIATDQNQRIGQVRYEGEVSLACRSIECGSVRISAADANGAHRFTFSGTTLIDTESGQSNAVLNGSLILPPM